MKYFPFKMQSGLTIMEMVMYMAIFAILLTILTQIFSATIDVQLESKATSSVQQDGQYILTRLTYDLQRASAITTPSLYGQAAGTLQLTINGVTNTYTTDGSNNLVLTNGQGSNFLNSADTTVSSVSFTRLGNPGGKSTIQLSYQMNSTTKRIKGNETKIFNTTIGLR